MLRWKDCPGCGTEFFGAGKYCSDKCSMGAVLDSVNQLKNKEGPIYDKWKKNLKAALKRL